MNATEILAYVRYAMSRIREDRTGAAIQNLEIIESALVTAAQLESTTPAQGFPGGWSVIRFIDMGKQIWMNDEDPDCTKYFAFWDTVTNRFLEFAEEQAWPSWNDFEEALKDHFGENYKTEPSFRPYYLRCKGLCADWVFGKTK
jgi:hypothetical protein